MNIKNNFSKMILTLIAATIIGNISAFFAPSDDPGANVFGGAATGALIGGLAGGGRGAGIGAGVGAGLGLIGSAASRDRYPRGRYYDRRPYNPNSRSSMRGYIAQLEQENQQLRDENYQLISQPQAPRR